MARTPISCMCALWPWPWRYDLGSRSWHTLASWTTIVWNIIQIQLGSEELIGPDTDFQNMCTVTLTLEIWPWVKVMTHPWVMDNNCVKYYQDPTWQWGAMARTPISCMCALWPWPWRYDLGSRSWHTLASWTTIVWNIIQIQLGSEELIGPDTDFQNMCTVTLTLEIWPWVKVMTHPWVMDNNCVKYYQDPTWQWGAMARTPISCMCALWPWPWRYDLGSRSWHTLASWTTIVWNIIQIQLGSEELIGPDTDFQNMCTVTLTLEIWPWVKVMTHPWVMDNNCVKYYQDPTWQWGAMARTPISCMCALWPWPWRYDLGSRSWHTRASWTTIVWNIIQIQLGSEELWPGHWFPVCVHCDLDLEDMTLGQGHDTRLGHGQQLCEILSRSNLAVRSYCQDTDFQGGGDNVAKYTQPVNLRIKEHYNWQYKRGLSCLQGLTIIFSVWPWPLTHVLVCMWHKIILKTRGQKGHISCIWVLWNLAS